MGPNKLLGPGPFIQRGLKVQAEKGNSSGLVIQVQNNLGTQPRTIQSSACPRSHKKEGQKWYRKQFGKKKSENICVHRKGYAGKYND